MKWLLLILILKPQAYLLCLSQVIMIYQYKILQGNTRIIIILPNTFKQMSNVFKIRERIEQSKKTCLLRKIKFYQYLVSYNTGADYPNSTAYNQSIKSFFPHVNYHTKLNTSSTIKAKMENSTQDTQTNTTETDILPAFQSTISSRSSAKESQKSRVPSRLNNTCSIIAKSMTPSIKTHLSPLKTTRVKMSSFVKRNNFSTISNSDKFEGVHQRQNTKKRSFVNNISYFKQQASTSSAKINYPRKQSIAPWDVGTEDF